MGGERQTVKDQGHARDAFFDHDGTVRAGAGEGVGPGRVDFYRGTVDRYARGAAACQRRRAVGEGDHRIGRIGFSGSGNRDRYRHVAGDLCQTVSIFGYGFQILVIPGRRDRRRTALRRNHDEIDLAVAGGIDLPRVAAARNRTADVRFVGRGQVLGVIDVDRRVAALDGEGRRVTVRRERRNRQRKEHGKPDDNGK